MASADRQKWCAPPVFVGTNSVTRSQSWKQASNPWAAPTEMSLKRIGRCGPMDARCQTVYIFLIWPSMTAQNKGKPNQLFHDLPEGLVVNVAWLRQKGYSTSLCSQYVAAGWLEKPAFPLASLLFVC